MALINKENELIEELRSAFREMQFLSAGFELTASGRAWIDNVERLKRWVLSDNPERFLQWDVIIGTMFVRGGRPTDIEFDFLKNLSTWEDRWCKAIEESIIGRPLPYLECPRSSGNLIHTAYHIAQFEQKTHTCVDETDLVFEFGGGYGSMCRLFYNLGYRKKYVIFDLPAFSALQQFYLKSIGMEVRPVDAFKESIDGVYCISDLTQLQTILLDQELPDTSMFIATWSISEVPLGGLRTLILSFAAQFDRILIAYQDRFREIDNFRFFHSWKALIKGVKWFHRPIKHLAPNRYLFGINRNVWER